MSQLEHICDDRKHFKHSKMLYFMTPRVLVTFIYLQAVDCDIAHFLPIGSVREFREPVVCVSVGAKHTLVICASNCVWAWGDNLHGQLGVGDCDPSACPRKITTLSTKRCVDVAAGRSHSLALCADGSMWSWGQGVDGRLGHGAQRR
jgi:alpha-tubulin suppressor-like RCC1 family protein